MWQRFQRRRGGSYTKFYKVMPEQYQKVNKLQYTFEFRAYNFISGKFLSWEENKDEILDILKGGQVGWSISQWVGHFDQDGKKIYIGDIVDIDVMNEFGSLIPEKGIILYDIERARYVIKTRSFPFEQSRTVGVKVISDMYLNKKYFDELVEYISVSPALIGL